MSSIPELKENEAAAQAPAEGVDRQATETEATEPDTATSESAPPTARASRAVRVFAACGLAFAAFYAAYERIGTIANVDEIEIYERFGGGFLALGRSESQPGVVVLSLLSEGEVGIDATGRRTWLTGRNTHVAITTLAGTWKKRLRGPLLALIHADGSVTQTAVPWSHADFGKIAKAVDCSIAGAEPKACGRPFDDLAELLAQWGATRVPAGVRALVTDARRSGDDPQPSRP